MTKTAENADGYVWTNDMGDRQELSCFYDEYGMLRLVSGAIDLSCSGDCVPLPSGQFYTSVLSLPGTRYVPIQETLNQLEKLEVVKPVKEKDRSGKDTAKTKKGKDKGGKERNVSVYELLLGLPEKTVVDSKTSEV